MFWQTLTQNGNATNATVIITVNSVDIDPLVKALKKQYPAIGELSGDEDKSLAEKVKELKDVKETAKTIVAAKPIAWYHSIESITRRRITLHLPFFPKNYV